MTALAGLAGALVAVGVLVLAAGLTRRDSGHARPPWFLTSIRGGLAAWARRAVLALAAGLALFALTGWPVLALAAVAAVIFVPEMSAVRSARQRLAVLEGLEQWARRLADVLSAGRGVEEALAISARTAPPAIARPAAGLSRRLRARAEPRVALLAFADEVDDPAGDQIAAALIIATSERGGAIGGVLTAAAENLARDVAARREVEADRAEQRTTIRWIIGFVGGFTVLAIVNRAYSAPFGTPAGEAVLALVSLLYAVGLAWLNRLSKVPPAGRFLTAPRTASRTAPRTAPRTASRTAPREAR
ncbi:MAG: type II secretion system F family protein [Streptosporangiaceae bacterium]